MEPQQKVIMHIVDRLKRRLQKPNDADWMTLLANPDESVPPLPPREIQEHFCGLSGLRAMQQAVAFYAAIRDFCKENGKPIQSMKAILDFGCGWGRITRCFLREVRTDVLFGCDVIPSMIEICQKSIPSYHFVTNNALPPSPFGEETFDLIYAYSVFSHLSEDAHKSWLQEFHRILKPNGIMVLTTRPRYFIGNWPNLAYLPKIDVDQLLKEYDAGKFVHIPHSSSHNLSDSFFGETAIPSAYMKCVWPKWFDLRGFRGDVCHVDQNVVFLVKERLRPNVPFAN